MATNTGFVQLVGPFAKDTPIEMNNVGAVGISGVISRLGIQSVPGHYVIINTAHGQHDFIIGLDGMLEFSGVDIKAITFKQDESSATILDMVYDYNVETMNRYEELEEASRDWKQFQQLLK